MNRLLAYFKAVDFMRAVALPVTALAAGVSVVSISLAFPVTAVITAFVLAFTYVFVNKYKKRMMRRIELLEKEKRITPEKLNEVLSMVNRVGVGGPSE
ncbi:MAG: hypothetical protein HY731_02745 [Candidatus Tectomicrobia bacterium]|nr:hypothetical protein [Candidatus Tectomicrobia bacterium]